MRKVMAAALVAGVAMGVPQAQAAITPTLNSFYVVPGDTVRTRLIFTLLAFDPTQDDILANGKFIFQTQTAFVGQTTVFPSVFTGQTFALQLFNNTANTTYSTVFNTEIPVFFEGTASDFGVTSGSSEIIGVKDDPNASGYTFVFSITEVPEPATMTLLGAGLVGLGLVRRRRG